MEIRIELHEVGHKPRDIVFARKRVEIAIEIDFLETFFSGGCFHVGFENGENSIEFEYLPGSVFHFFGFLTTAFGFVKIRGGFVPGEVGCPFDRTVRKILT